MFPTLLAKAGIAQAVSAFLRLGCGRRSVVKKRGNRSDEASMKARARYHLALPFIPEKKGECKTDRVRNLFDLKGGKVEVL